MLKSLFGRGPETIKIGTINYIFGGEIDLSEFDSHTFENSLMAASMAALAVRRDETTTEEEKAEAKSLFEYAAKMHNFKLSSTVVTEKSGFSSDRLQCLSYLLCIEHQMKALSVGLKEKLFMWLSMEIETPKKWIPSDDKLNNGEAEFPFLMINATISQRHTPFVTFHPRLLSSFPGGIEAAVFEFLKVFRPYLAETVDSQNLQYVKSGLTSLIEYWDKRGIPRAGSPSPALPFLLNWQK